MRQWPPIAILVATALLLVLAWIPPATINGWGRLASILALAGMIGAALWRLWWLERRAALSLDQLRGWVNLLASTPADQIQAGRLADPPDIAGAQGAILGMLGRHLEEQGILIKRFGSMLSKLPEGVAVINAEGLITLVNAAGRGLFEGLQPAVGKSAFAVLSRHSLEVAIHRAMGSVVPISASLLTVHGEAIEASVTYLGEEGGILLQYPASKADAIGEIEHDLTLHDRAPAPAPLSATHSLAALPILALDTETTGLDPGSDRIVSIGAVRMVGSRIYRGAAINELVDPGRRIPPGTIAIHGISNAMVAGAPCFADVAARVEAATAGLVLLGHHIDFDCAMIRAEMGRIGRQWSPAATLDVMLLYAGLDPQAPEISLDAIARALGVALIGRHSALGDALGAAEIYARLAPMLASRGVRDLSQASEFSQAAWQHLQARRQLARGRRQ